MRVKQFLTSCTNTEMPFTFKKPIRKFTLHNPRINRGLTSVNCYGAKKILGTSYDIPGNILIPRDIQWNS